jgi:hypothetical protein
MVSSLAHHSIAAFASPEESVRRSSPCFGGGEMLGAESPIAYLRLFGGITDRAMVRAPQTGARGWWSEAMSCPNPVQTTRASIG